MILSLRPPILSANLPCSVNNVDSLIGSCTRCRSWQAKLHSTVFELVRLVRVYSPRWRSKESVISKLLDDYRAVRNEKQILLREVTLNAGVIRRLRHNEAVSKWERIFIQASANRRHGTRWKYLIDDLKAMYDPEISGTTQSGSIQAPDEDESDDEHYDEQPKLPQKKKSFGGFKTNKSRSSNTEPGDGHVGIAQETSKKNYAPASTTLESENIATLKTEIELLKALLDRGPLVSQAAQTEAPDNTLDSSDRESNSLMEEGDSKALSWSSKFVTPEVLCIELLSIEGWAGVIPGDLYCSIELRQLDDPTVPTIEPPQETASSTMPAIPDETCCVSTFVSETLDLVTATKDHILILFLRSSFNGDIMARGQCKVKYLLDQRAQGVYEPSTLDDDIVATTKTSTSFQIPMKATELYFQYRTEAVPNATATTEVDLRLNIGCHVSTYAERKRLRDQDGARMVEDQSAVTRRKSSVVKGVVVGEATSTRRQSRLQSAFAGDLPIIPDDPKLPDGNPMELTGFLFDPNEMELEKASFTMHEVMVLAMLHAKQLQVIRDNYEQQLQEERDKIPPPPVVATVEAQTDFPPPEPEIVEVERIVEREVKVEIEVEKVVEKRVEVKVPVEVEVEKKVPFVFAPDGQRDIPKVRNYSVRDPLYLADMPDDFFERLNFFTARKLKNLQNLSDKTRRVVQKTLLGEMEAKNTVERFDVDSYKVTAQDDVILPAVHMPSPGLTYASNAGNSFHAGAGSRITQPPSTGALPPLSYLLEHGIPPRSDAGMRTLNLYEQGETMENSSASNPDACTMNKTRVMTRTTTTTTTSISKAVPGANEDV